MSYRFFRVNPDALMHQFGDLNLCMPLMCTNKAHELTRHLDAASLLRYGCANG